MAGDSAAGRLARLLLFTMVVAASAQFSGKRDKPKSPAFKSDIKYIQCDVCDAMTKEARHVVKLLKIEARNLKVGWCIAWGCTHCRRHRDRRRSLYRWHAVTGRSVSHQTNDDPGQGGRHPRTN